MDQSIQDILNTIDSAISDFQDTIPDIQKSVYDELQPMLKEFQVKNGMLLNNLDNLKLLSKLQAKLERIIITAEYKQNVQAFIDSFSIISNLNLVYFRQFNQNLSPLKTLPFIQQMAVENTINDLLGEGLRINLIRPVKGIISQNITSGGSYGNFNEELRQWIIGTKNEEGNILKYTRQISTDAINQFNAQYQETIAQDLKFNWGRYVGSLITTSREFCVYLVKKQWAHKSELPAILEGHIDGHDCRLSKTTGLPYGMIPGTNVDNFKIRRGGYNCGHQFFWVPDSAVPVNVKAKITK